MPPRFLYFDLGNVLLSFSHVQMYAQMADAIGIAADKMQGALLADDAVGSMRWRYEAGQIDTDTYLNYVCERIGAQCDRTKLEAAACDIFTPILPMVELVRRLAFAGNRLGILSNTNPVQWNFITDGRFPWIQGIGQPASPFLNAVLSYEVGSMKPDRHIYDVAIARAGVPASDIFFTDDRADNVAGALAAGLDAVQFQNAQQLIRELHVRHVAGA